MNKDNASGKFDQVAGKVKQGIGEAVGSEKLANEGAAQQVKGHVKEAWGNAKDTASDIADNHRHDGDSVRDSITNAAHDAKEKINRGLDNMKDNDDAKHRKAS